MTVTVGISTGKSVTNSKIKNQAGDWDKLVERLLNFKVTDETYEDYIAMPPDQQARIKDVGYFIGGQFKGDTRKRDSLRFRSLITLDLDHLPAEEFDDIEMAFYGYEYVVHSTHKHSSKTPRYRIVMLLDRNCTPKEYPALARKIADKLDIDYFDETAFRIAQLMYWPSRSVDGEEVAVYVEGLPIEVDEILAEYDDWEDFGEWPKTCRESRINSGDATAADPYEKTGIIGKFCRRYDIHQAISTFELPYETTEWENRYRPVGSTGASGAVVYPSDMCEAAFLYSHHESDVVGSQNVNSWDLVRLHKFHELDEEGVDYESPTSTPSHKAMVSLALTLEGMDESELTADEEFSNTDDIRKTVSDAVKSSGVEITFESLMEELETVNESGRSGRKAFMTKLAAAKLSVSDIDEVLNKLRDVTGIGKLSLKKDLKQLQKEIVRSDDDRTAINDVELKVLHIILKKFDKGEHIKRVGKQWWGYAGGVWARKEDEYIQGIVQQTLFKFKDTELPDAEMDVYEYFQSTKISTISASMYNLFTAHVASKETGPDPLHLAKRISVPVINCLNCEIYFEQDGSFRIEEHDPANFFTNQISVTYDPEATCPEWDRFIGIITKETIDPEENIRHLEEVMGYTIQMSRWLKTFILFRGSTDTGKSTVAAVLERMLGEAVTSTEMSSFGDNKSNFAESNLVGKLLILDDDFKKGAQLPDGFIKRVSEEKAITADVKYAAPINFVSRALPMILSNYWPMTRDITDAFRERAMVFEFLHRISGAEKSNERRDKMLNNELSGVLNRLVKAIGRLHARQRWMTTIDTDMAHARWVGHANPVSMFLTETMAQKADVVVKRTEVWNKYLNWFKHSNPSGRASSKSEFYERMESLIGKSVKRGGIDCFVGYEFVEMEADEEFSDERE